MIKHFISIYKSVAAICIGCFFVMGCENEIKKVQDLGKKKLGIEEGINIESYMSQSGKMKAKLKAPFMLRYLLDTPKVEFTKTMHVDFYDDTLGIESQMSCKYGRYLENDNKIYLYDSVVVFNRTGDTLWTDELLWDQVRAEFYTDKFVKVKRGFNATYLKARKGLRSDQTLKNIFLFYVGEDSYFTVPDSAY